MSESKKLLKVTQIRSGIGRPIKQKRILVSLGLNKIRRERIFEDCPQIRGAIFKVKHLVQVEEIEAHHD